MQDDIKIFLPKLGESILSATVVKWHKKVGDLIDLDESLLEVATDKVNSEIPSPTKGILKEILAKESEEIHVGEALCIIASENTSHVIETKSEIPKKSEVDNENFLSPVAKVLAKNHNLSIDELKNISRTGAGGRLSKKDIETYLKSDKETKNENIEMNFTRKAIAKAMVKAHREIPTASIFSKVNISNIMKLIAKEKKSFLKKNGYKLTITSFLAKAIAHASEMFPLTNSSYQNDNILIKKNVNLGIAVNVATGLVVPNIKLSETKNITEIAKEVSILGEKARTNSLSPIDIENGTITMTNFGMGGALIGIPIIKHPESVIIGVGAIAKEVVVSEDNQMKIADTLMITVTFDHRVFDGMYGCSFLKCIKDFLENLYEIY